MDKAIMELAGGCREEVVGFLREIIGIRSPVGEEGAVVARIKVEMERLGYNEVMVDPLGNLLGRIGSGSRVLAIDGHCDTVDVGNPALWSIDPFKGDLRDGIVYGRGAVDQKGGLAAAIYAGKILREVGVPDEVTVWVAASVLEEGYEGFNWEYIIEEDKIVPEAVVLTEPTNLQISVGHKGRADIKIRTEGKSAHGSRPDMGVNAIYKMMPIVREIERLHPTLGESELLGKATITVTDIRSASPNLNAVPDSAEIFVDRRLTEGETAEEAVEQLRRLPAVVEAQGQVAVAEFEVKSYTGLALRTKSSYPGWCMAADHPLVTAAREAYQDLFGEKSRLRTWAFSTNGVATRGKYNIPTIGFGPGDDKYAHTVEDQVPVEQVVKAMAFYAGLVKRFVK